ncbi:MAG: hypothetical protein Q4G25_12960 [Paracoccus sp. (in: a-proteobacteria)]|nr:hypothetical protein [Paracoccus sp. (in: a-proteobacteria)]
MLRLSLIGAVALVAACTTPEQARRDSYVGTENGQTIYVYTVQHWPTALWSESKLEHWIRSDAEKLCPQGYREVSRERGANHVYYGSPVAMPYYDLNIRIACPAPVASG